MRDSIDAAGAAPPQQNFNTINAGPSRAQVAMSMPSPMTTKNIANARLRGRIHQGASDVLNGIGGMEHLSNSVQQRKAGNNESTAILANMRGAGGSNFMHHSSMP